MTLEEIVKLGVSKEIAEELLRKVDEEYVKSGQYIPKAKFDQLLAEKNQLKAQVEQANSSLATLKKEAEGNEALKSTIEELQRKTKDLESQHKAELLTLRKKSAIIADLGPIAHNPSDVVGFVDLSKVSIDDNGAIVGGWEEQKKGLLSAKPYMFKTIQGQPGSGGSGVSGNPSPNPNGGAQGGAGGNGNGGTGDTIVDFAKSIAAEAKAPKYGSDTYFGESK